MEWLGDNMWAVWLALALILATCEMLTLDLTLLMLASGALAAMLTAIVLPGLWPVQLLVGAAVSVLMLFFLRPTLLKRVRDLPGYHSQLDRMVGSEGVALAEVTAGGGEVKISGETWSARAAAPGLLIRPGDQVVVQGIDGATVIVTPRYQSLQ